MNQILFITNSIGEALTWWKTREHRAFQMLYVVVLLNISHNGCTSFLIPKNYIDTNGSTRTLLELVWKPWIIVINKSTRVVNITMNIIEATREVLVAILNLNYLGSFKLPMLVSDNWMLLHIKIFFEEPYWAIKKPSFLPCLSIDCSSGMYDLQ